MPVHEQRTDDPFLNCRLRDLPKFLPPRYVCSLLSDAWSSSIRKNSPSDDLLGNQYISLFITNRAWHVESSPWRFSVLLYRLQSDQCS